MKTPRIAVQKRTYRFTKKPTEPGLHDEVCRYPWIFPEADPPVQPIVAIYRSAA